jgi:hypothetical protein
MHLGDCRAIVREDRDRRSVTLRVRGGSPARRGRGNRFVAVATWTWTWTSSAPSLPSVRVHCRLRFLHFLRARRGCACAAQRALRGPAAARPCAPRARRASRLCGAPFRGWQRSDRSRSRSRPTASRGPLAGEESGQSHCARRDREKMSRLVNPGTRASPVACRLTVPGQEHPPLLL